MIPPGVLFFVVLFILAQFIAQYFIIFIIYSGLCMVTALTLSLIQMIKRGEPAFRWFTAGLLTMILASVLQALRLGPFRLIWLFDHNTLYHTVMMAALFLLDRGLRDSLDSVIE